jgi:hypothetical protein
MAVVSGRNHWRSWNRRWWKKEKTVHDKVWALDPDAGRIIN